MNQARLEKHVRLYGDAVCPWQHLRIIRGHVHRYPPMQYTIRKIMLFELSESWVRTDSPDWSPKTNWVMT